MKAKHVYEFSQRKKILLFNMLSPSVLYADFISMGHKHFDDGSRLKRRAAECLAFSEIVTSITQMWAMDLRQTVPSAWLRQPKTTTENKRSSHCSNICRKNPYQNTRSIRNDQSHPFVNISLASWAISMWTTSLLLVSGSLLTMSLIDTSGPWMHIVTLGSLAAPDSWSTSLLTYSDFPIPASDDLTTLTQHLQKEYIHICRKHT